MPAPIETLPLVQARLATEIRLIQIVVAGDDASWDWELHEHAHSQPLAVSAYRSSRSEPRETLEEAVRLTLAKVGVTISGAPLEVTMQNDLTTLRYRVTPVR